MFSTISDATTPDYDVSAELVSVLYPFVLDVLDEHVLYSNVVASNEVYSPCSILYPQVTDDYVVLVFKVKTSTCQHGAIARANDSNVVFWHYVCAERVRPRLYVYFPSSFICYVVYCLLYYFGVVCAPRYHVFGFSVYCYCAVSFTVDYDVGWGYCEVRCFSA